MVIGDGLIGRTRNSGDSTVSQGRIPPPLSGPPPPPPLKKPGVGVSPQRVSQGNRRVIKTGRTTAAINEAAQQGYWPLVKPVKPSDQIHSLLGVFQNPKSGEIELSGDCRITLAGEKVIDYAPYYPYSFPNPFAAYLLPKDLAAGENVWLEDLIEDIVATWHAQHRLRLAEAPAIWNGSDFEIQFSLDINADFTVG